MAKAVPFTKLKGSVLQGGADAFVQGSITTGLSNLTGKAYKVRQLQLRHPTLGGTDNAQLQIAFGPKSLSAIPLLSDNSCDFYYERWTEATAAGSWQADLAPRWNWDADNWIIVSDPYYIYVDSASMGTSTIAWSMEVEEVTLSEAEKSAILLAALQ